ncbi:hypothetical protein R7P75_04520 [Vibrio sp. 2175-1]|uniref:hypothetical protein n=1 Tax=Vibrio TaxID=662 RepID=UPI001CDCAEB4|nr:MULTISPECIES: hypothetical protein [Vibrio]MCA2497782.1 hypothetical protein [Vibrio alginolyticus]MDW2217469.1 hypothetical protein [Vibrio sp. 2175-1]
MKYQSETFHNRVYIGAHGNLSLEQAKLTANAAEVADVFQVLELPVGVKITGVRLFTDGIGVGVTADVTVGETTLIAAEDVSGATALVTPIKPLYIDEKSPLEVTIGGAAATGELVVMVEYVNVGY